MLREMVDELLGHLGADERTQRAIYKHLLPSMELMKSGGCFQAFHPANCSGWGIFSQARVRKT